MPAQPTELADGRYAVGEPIATGAMGAVLRGRRTSDGLDVAIKRLLDPRHAVRFEIEARLLARLDHPRVVHVLDHFADGGESYLVMELVRGDDLRRRARAADPPRLPVAEAVAHVCDACDALEYVHGENVVHRDVKPQNLILDEERGVVLVDFGIARESRTSGTMTVGAGTPGYMAPEVAAGGAASARSDVYGLAATLWALVAGAPPRYGLRDPLASLVPDAGDDVEAALRAGLALDPAARLPSAAALARALGGTMAGATAGASLARTVSRPAAPRGDARDRGPRGRRRARGDGGLARVRRRGDRRAGLRGGLGRGRRPDRGRAPARGQRDRRRGGRGRAPGGRRGLPRATRASPGRSPRVPATSPTR